jgi:8-oxo-dGTP pyrophosphatase MutT (NUDIX family)
MNWRSNTGIVDVSNIPTKKSLGIILCKINTITNQPEVLLVHKRYTYAYSMFVHGKYSRPNIWPKSSMQFIINLLNQMTLEELLEIWSLNFKQMWYRIWLNNIEDEFYKRKYNKFFMSFIKNDTGDQLKKYILSVRNYSSLNWEVPKGRPIDFQEKNLHCAIREIKEETGLNKTDYTILPNVKRYVNYVSLGTRYICTYYIAIVNHCIKYYNTSVFKDMKKFNEVSETKWFDINKIRLIDDHKHHLESLISPAFKLVKKFNSGKWPSRCKKISEITLQSTL